MPIIILIDESYIFGFHFSKLPTLCKTVEKVFGSGLSAFQLYLGSSRSFNAPNINVKDLTVTRKLLQERKRYVFAHACLLYSICGFKKEETSSKFQKLSNVGMVASLDIISSIGGKGVVIHPGSNANIAEGISNASLNINKILRKVTESTKEIAKGLGVTVDSIVNGRCIILENSAQEGNKRAGTLEEIRDIILGVDKELRDRVGVCIDTAHAFGAGLYDWGKPSEVERFFRDFDEIIGLKYLKLIHLNDSCAEGKNSAPFESKKDRHANLGTGWIFSDTIAKKTEEGSRLEGLKKLLLRCREHKIPMIGEPPGKGTDDSDLIVEITSETDYPYLTFIET